MEVNVVINLLNPVVCAFFNSISSAFDIIWQINRQTKFNGYPSNESIKINHLWTVNQEMATFSLVFASCRCNRSLVGPRTICAWVHDNYIIRPGDYRSTVPHNGRGVSPDSLSSITGRRTCNLNSYCGLLVMASDQKAIHRQHDIYTNWTSFLASSRCWRVI